MSTPLGGRHASETVESWASSGGYSLSWSGGGGSGSTGASWSNVIGPLVVQESWSWDEEPAGPLAPPEFLGPDETDYGDLVAAIAAESAGAYNDPATRDAAVDAAIAAFVSLDADDQGQGGGAMYEEVREAGEEGGEGESDGGGGTPSPGGYPGGWWNPGNW